MRAAKAAALASRSDWNAASSLFDFRAFLTWRINDAHAEPEGAVDPEDDVDAEQGIDFRPLTINNHCMHKCSVVRSSPILTSSKSLPSSFACPPPPLLHGLPRDHPFPLFRGSAYLARDIWVRFVKLPHTIVGFRRVTAARSRIMKALSSRQHGLRGCNRRRGIRVRIAPQHQPRLGRSRRGPRNSPTVHFQSAPKPTTAAYAVRRGSHYLSKAPRPLIYFREQYEPTSS